MISLICWLNWQLTRQTKFVGLSVENIKELYWTIYGPDFELTFYLDLIVVLSILLTIMIISLIKDYKTSSENAQ